MQAEVKTFVLSNWEPHQVSVQVETRHGQAGFCVVGMADRGITESRHRIFSACRKVGIKLPGNILINLTPVDLKKTGGIFDLAIVVSLLTAKQAFRQKPPAQLVVLGQIGIGGEVSPIPAQFALMQSAIASGFNHFLISSQAIDGLDLLSKCQIFCLDNISELAGFDWRVPRSTWKKRERPTAPTIEEQALLPLEEQRHAWRAISIALAGGHHLMLRGSPGCGKSLIASCVKNLLPVPLEEEQRQICYIESLKEQSGGGSALSTVRPFRAPSHRSSFRELFGNSRILGELVQAHHGVLFLDELSEFSPRLLEALRLPLDTGHVAVFCDSKEVVLPCRFTLIAATNTCGCNGSENSPQDCNCSTATLRRYESRLSVALLDRIDLLVDLNRSRSTQLKCTVQPEPFSLRELQTRICKAHVHAVSSRGCISSLLPESILLSEHLVCHQARELLEVVCERRKFSLRRYFNLLRVGVTIADLEESERVLPAHVAEALSFSGANKLFSSQL